MAPGAPPHVPRRAKAALLVLVLAAAAAVLAAGGCSRRVESDLQAPARDAEWAWLTNARRLLEERRARLPEPPVPGAARPTPPGQPAPADVQGREVDTLAAELSRRLVAYVNADPPVEGTPLTPRQLAAIRMKSDEEIAVAHDFVARGGDYRRACDILEAALAADPRNPRLRDELAATRAARYLTADRFAHALPGMTGDQVRAALGPPNLRDVRTYPAAHGAKDDDAIVAWFYPRDAAGTAAAIWFDRRPAGLVAYRCDWDALPAAGDGSER